MKRQLAFILFISVFATYVFSSTLIVVGCGGGGGGGGWVAGVAPPTINTRGGDGGSDTGAGGWGGDVTVEKLGGTGPVEVLSSGTVDASFTPTAAAPNLGTDPVNITADKTIPLDPVFPGGDPGAGEPYMLSAAPGSLYISDGDGNPAPGDADDVTATGLSVAGGTTLTLPLNSGGTIAFIIFSDDVENNGTITTADVDPTQRGSLELYFFSYYGGSAIDTSGAVPGQSGGDILLATPPGLPNQGIYNRGAINTAGADDAGGTGGNGGDVTLAGYDPLENSGAITTAGGTGGAGDGGAGGIVFMVSAVAYLYNSGAINSIGGDGTGSGGQGGDVTIGGVSGELRNSGAVSTTGGNGAGGPGGAGGDIALVGLSAGLLNNAALNSAGGDTSEATSGGGDGGDISVASLPVSITAGPAGNLLLAGNIDSSGGNALATGSGNGGWGGDVLVGVDASGSFSSIPGLPAPTTQRLALRSHGNIDTSGGSGNQGGDGGFVEVVDDGERWDTGTSFVDDVGGDVTNQAAITTRGGSVAAGASTTPATGGLGGDVNLYGDQDTTVTNPAAERVTNSGRIDTSGGDSLALDAVPFDNAGVIDLYTTNDITNTGALTANGGSDAVNDDNLATGFGHDGAPWVELYTILATATNSGTINANGGDGEAMGGWGSFFGVYLGEVQVVNSANISARGGNADTGLAGSVGGDGGIISFEDVDTPDNTGTLDVSGGAGETPGADGTIFP